MNTNPTVKSEVQEIKERMMRSLGIKLTDDVMLAYNIMIHDKTLDYLKQQWIAKNTDEERKEFLQTNRVLKKRVTELKQQRFLNNHQGCSHSHFLKKPPNQLLPVQRKRMTFQDFKDKFLKFLEFFKPKPVIEEESKEINDQEEESKSEESGS